jgi:peptidoglycan/LPS O-acetylase OafA/YrhL
MIFDLKGAARPVKRAVIDRRRLDIQGLRGVALLLILAIHAGIPDHWLGGRVGLDIYFVISGYVITGVIQRQQTTGRFSFGQFYLRRFKRLTPALALMVAVTMVLSFCLLPPLGPQQLTAQLGLGVILLTANFAIIRNPDDYYHAPLGSYPLLQTWSLSVEEQYYLVFPAILVLGYVLSQRGRRFPWAAVLVGTAAAISIWLAMVGPWALGPLAPFAKYLVGFGGVLARVWEFLVGVLLALATTNRCLRSDKLAQFFALLGIALIVGSVWLINNGVLSVRDMGLVGFPGLWWTLLPVSGTLLVIAAGTHHSTWVNRALAFPAMVKIGDWSYAIYLWHWPLMAFAFYFWPQVRFAAVLAGILSILPALASYRWVEQPIRRLPPMTRPRTFALVGAVVVPPILLAATVNFAADHYWLPRYKSGAVPIAHQGDTDSAEFFQHFGRTYYPCTDQAIRDSAELWNGMARCWQSKPGSRIDVALVGDSHAEQLFPGLAAALPNKNVVYYIRAALPVESAAGMDRIIDHVASDPGIETVIVTADWAKRGVAREEFVKTLEAFRSRGKAVFVTDDVPGFDFDSVFCKYRTTPILPLSRCSEARQMFEAAHALYYPVLRAAVAEVPGVQLLNTAQYFCDTDLCSMNKGDALLYRDLDHLNNVGSRFLANWMITDFPQFRSVVTQP